MFPDAVDYRCSICSAPHLSPRGIPLSSEKPHARRRTQYYNHSHVPVSAERNNCSSEDATDVLRQVPSAFHLPLQSSGKVKRLVLPEPASSFPLCQRTPCIQNPGQKVASPDCPTFPARCSHSFPVAGQMSPAGSNATRPPSGLYKTRNGKPRSSRPPPHTAGSNVPKSYSAVRSSALSLAADKPRHRTHTSAIPARAASNCSGIPPVAPTPSPATTQAAASPPG